LHVDGEGQIYSRWLEITLADIQLLSESRAEGEKSPGSEESKPEPANAQVSPPTPGKETPGDEARYRDIRTRVETLKRLRSDGVISETEYQEQLEKVISETSEK
jgi:hypothetical protein